MENYGERVRKDLDEKLEVFDALPPKTLDDIYDLIFKGVGFILFVMFLLSCQLSLLFCSLEGVWK